MLGKLHFAAATILAALIAVPAQAQYMYDLSVTGAWTGSGSIDFSSLTGNSPAGVSAFSFDVTSGLGSPQTYSLSDIASIMWTIDSSSFDVTSLLLTSSLKPFGTAQSAILLNLANAPQPDPCIGVVTISPASSYTCVTAGPHSVSISGGFLGAERQTAVPEPTTLALFSLGMAGLGFSRRRRVI